MKPSFLLLSLLLSSLGLAGCSSAPDNAGTEIQASNQGSSHFAPELLTVAVGARVTFKVTDDSHHTVDFAEGTLPVDGISKAHSGDLGAGQTFQVTFAQAGTFHYFCAYHSSVAGSTRTGMVGTIEVT